LMLSSELMGSLSCFLLDCLFCWARDPVDRGRTPMVRSRCTRRGAKRRSRAGTPPPRSGRGDRHRPGKEHFVGRVERRLGLGVDADLRQGGAESGLSEGAEGVLVFPGVDVVTV